MPDLFPILDKFTKPMKAEKSIFIGSACILLMLLASVQARAQHIQLSPLIGYQTGTKFKTDVRPLHLEDGMELGAIFSIGLGGGRFGEVSYSHSFTELSLDQGPIYTPISHLGINYFSIGLLQDIYPKKKITPFGLLALGIINYNPSEGNVSASNQMHISIGGGMKTKLSQKISLRFQARLIVPVNSDGTYFKSGSDDSGYNIAGGIHSLQADISGAVVFRLK